MSDKPFLLEIDDQAVEYTDLYDSSDCVCGAQVGSIAGAYETTKPGDVYRSFVPSGVQIWIVNVYRRNPDGSIWGIKGAFKCGQWDKDNDRPILRVWERIL
jgi:hypothetical protein